jgi:replicative DNA helicase
MKLSTRDIIEKIKGEKKDHEVMPTGFPKLDKILDGGFFTKELVVLGAHTGVGKSQIAGQILLTIADQGFKTAYFSLEISNEMILSRLVGLKTNIKPTMVRFGNLTPDEHAARLKAEAAIVALGDNINYYDDCYDLESILKEIRLNKFEFVVIDFIQNVVDRVTDEYSRLSKAAIAFQRVAKEANCTLLVLSQLSNTFAREGRKSKTLEYKGSGSIAMVADLGFFLERPAGCEDSTDYEQSSGTELTIKKNRRGLSGYQINFGYQLPGGLVYEK